LTFWKIKPKFDETKIKIMSDKIEDHELTRLQESNNKLGACLHDIGILEHQKSKVLNMYSEYLKQFEILKDELNVKYGKVNIDIATGEFKPIEDDKEEGS
tara:strand:+ start:326 stop:625 length:300 start_codon:yes stop_codon:yes gene_type:complete